MIDNRIFQTIAEKYAAYATERQLPWVDPSLLVNAVDKNGFNYSLEEPILRRFGSFMDVNSEYNMSTIQPCIRGADVTSIKRGQTKNHLSLFHIFPTSFQLSPNSQHLRENCRQGIKNTLMFLDSLGLKRTLLQVTYFAGGRLDVLSKGSVPVQTSFPADTITKEAFLDEEVSESQLHPIAGLDTFVATFSGDQDFYAGNRYEIHYPLSTGELLEIGTGEALEFRQVRRGKNTIDIIPAAYSITPIVVGLERICAIVCGSETVRTIPPLMELGHVLSKLFPEPISLDYAVDLADAFRAAHLVLTQTHALSLNASLRRQRRAVVSRLCGLFGSISIHPEDLIVPLELVAAQHSWLPDLRNEIPIVSRLIPEYIKYKQRMSVKAVRSEID